jgi:hypothetical protein
VYANHVLKVLEELRRDIEKTCGSGIFNPDKSKEPNCPNFFVLIILEKDGIEPRSVLKHWGDVAHGESHRPFFSIRDWTLRDGRYRDPMCLR